MQKDAQKYLLRFLNQSSSDFWKLRGYVTEGNEAEIINRIFTEEKCQANLINYSIDSRPEHFNENKAKIAERIRIINVENKANSSIKKSAIENNFRIEEKDILIIIIQYCPSKQKQWIIKKVY